jgi:hypothetical protein
LRRAAAGVAGAHFLAPGNENSARHRLQTDPRGKTPMTIGAATSLGLALELPLPGRAFRVSSNWPLHRAGAGTERGLLVCSVVSPRQDRIRDMRASARDHVLASGWGGQLPHRASRVDSVRSRGREARAADAPSVYTCSAVRVHSSAN